MRQLLIVKSISAVGDHNPINYNLLDNSNLSRLQEGCISFIELGNNELITTMPTTNFAIALGRPNGQHPFIIPEVDIKTLHITKSLPREGVKFGAGFTLGTTEIGKEYTLRFFKKGVVPHERNSWTASIVAKTNNSGYAESEALKNDILSKVNDKFPFTVERSNGALAIECNNVGEDWEIVGMDGLSGTEININRAKPNIGDKDYIQKLASFCAAGKGFNHTNGEGRDIIPGYPEYVENFTLDGNGGNGTSSTGYAVYTLRFQVGRDASKTRDERVWQNVYIAVPRSTSGGGKGGNTKASPGGSGTSGSVDLLDLFDEILPVGDYYQNLMIKQSQQSSGDDSGDDNENGGEA